MIRRIQPARRVAEALQALLIIGLPFLKIRGESALRFDVPSLQLHFFGTTLWMDEFFIVLAALIFMTFLIALVTLLFGRIWCGWTCPQTVLIDFTWFVDRAGRKGPLARAAALLAAFVVSLVVAASLIWYFVSPYEFFTRLFAGRLGSIIGGFWIVLTGIIFADFALLRHRFCATVCPYAKMQSALFDRKTLVIAFDPARKEECMNCSACVKVCPVGVDIRNGLSAACINCAECIDACGRMMEKKKSEGLIGYSFGLPGETGRFIRGNALLIGSITAVSLLFFVYLSMTRAVFDMTILPDYAFPARLAAEGKAVNAYFLSAENRGGTDLVIEIKARGEAGGIRLTPSHIALKAGERRKMPVYAVMEGVSKKGVTVAFVITAMSGKNEGTMIEKKVYFTIPEEK
jgi:cytochrome c oxidase accessory protein FixG